MNLEEEISNQMASQLREEIDGELMADMLVSMGWTKIKDQFYRDNKQAVDLNLWLEEHCTGMYKRLGSNWVFENNGDAVNYALKWA